MTNLDADMRSFDSYYSPPGVARAVAAAVVGGSPPETVVDPACGSGSLLAAVAERFPRVGLTGLDIDQQAVRKLRRIHPGWRLGVVNLLCRRSFARSPTARAAVGADWVVTNPPFSMGRSNGISGRFLGVDLRCSVAMAHLLTSIEILRPALGTVAIVPESLLASERDSHARHLLEAQFSIERLNDFPRSTFPFARAASSLVKLSPLRGTRTIKAVRLSDDSCRSTIRRGGLPVHQAQEGRGGLPYVHSDGIAFLAQGGGLNRLRRVEGILRGRVSGDVILVPRVGVPSPRQVRLIHLECEAQLSDCVIAIVPPAGRGDELERTMLDRWCSFTGNYRGTGARFVTVKRLRHWLAGVGM